ncbi:MAG: hypothetical protein HYS35_04540 [Betaproteobacteria bacterium]|nr:hypothetical protein [Betaproteobacteria bacterium]
MASRGFRSTGSVPIALAALMALVCVAGIAAVTGWLALPRNQSAVASAFHAAPACRICGVVEQVRELDNAGVKAISLNGDRDESFVILLATLLDSSAGARGGSAPRTFETAVRFEDGSVRLLRDSRAPQWKPGDRVKVLRGRVEPIS